MSDEQLTKNFRRSEFACQGENCCDRSAPISLELVDNLQLLRDLVGVSLTISGPFRCRKHNKSVGGAPNSLHCLGLAVDVMVPKGLTADQFYRIAEAIPAFARGGIGVYSNRLHLDIRRNGPARWDNR